MAESSMFDRYINDKMCDDAVRAREVYRYFQPTTHASSATNELPPEPCPFPDQDLRSFDNLAGLSSNVSSGKISSPDTALTAFAQLVSWRTNCQRAMISLIDRETQYFIAESTKTLDLVDNTRHEPLDALWVGCTEVPKQGRLCEKTIGLPPREQGGEYRAFIIADLSKDVRFNELPFVAGPPYLKFYAGIPLITKRGIPIGSLFVVDDRARHRGLSNDELHFMGTMGETIIRHLEATREVQEHRRGMKMSRGLASFVEGRSQLEEDEVDCDDEGESLSALPVKPRTRVLPRHIKRKTSLTSVTSASTLERKSDRSGDSKLFQDIQGTSPQLPVHGTGDRPSIISDPSVLSQASIDTFTDSITSTSTGKSPEIDQLSEASTLQVVFSRASNLIREAFEIDGGSVFFDAQKGLGNDLSPDTIMEDSNGQMDLPSSGGEGSACDRPEFSKFAHMSTADRGSVFGRSIIKSSKAVEVLGFSTSNAASIHGDRLPGPSIFTPIGERSLHALFRRYPRGKLFIFEDNGPAVSSSEDDAIRQSRNGDNKHEQNNVEQKRARNIAEARILLRHFPGAKQLLFAPLWDSSRNRWLAGNFTWTKDPTRILSKQQELAFLTGFGNSVIAECSRLDTEAADEKKTAFIGSISHELRSPLHGIMASAEFLGEEVSDGFSKGLVETITSCGRTLLDTINHILDYSKVNNLEKNWRKSRRRSQSGRQLPAPDRMGGVPALKQAGLPMINLFADVNVSSICEEVIEGVYAGHAFQTVVAPSFDMVADQHGKMSDRKHPVVNDLLDAAKLPEQSEVAVIFDVDMADYNLITQPGAFKRVVMNLLGNALKYTSYGYVKVKLEATDMEDFRPRGSRESLARSCITLTVTDTGRGIAPEFLRSKLFTPFAQENSLSAGTGLGLSIVKSIVSLLEGEIQIKSEVGQGTEVKVILPLLKELPKDSISVGHTPQSAGSTQYVKDGDEIISRLRQKVVGKTVALYGFNIGGVEDVLANESNHLLESAIINLLVNWYGLRIVKDTDNPDIIIANEADVNVVDKFVNACPGRTRSPLVLSLCSHSTRLDRRRASMSTKARTGYLAKPVGPLKVARALLQCLEGAPSTPSPGLVAPDVGIAMLKDDIPDTWLSNGHEVLDNGRVLADSANARKLIESPTPLAPSTEKHKEFPFPSLVENRLPRTQSMPADKQSLLTATAPLKVAHEPLPRASVMLTEMEKTSSSTNEIAKEELIKAAPTPRLLLVDDNKINLRLLRTYMVKRRYRDVDEAENGLEAVQAVESNKQGYDIIFMDISMPILDGFGATREIRKLEAARKERRIAAGETPVSPALIIALTGLASSKDQSEAFTSGVDLFLTKPVAFKAVGRLLDNWQANKAQESDPSSDLYAEV